MILTPELIDLLHTARIERTRRWMEALQVGYPEVRCAEMGGGIVSYAGDGSPRSHAYGIGHLGTEFDLDEIDAFYGPKAGTWELIVTPFDSEGVLKEAARLGCVPIHFRNVLAMSAESVEPMVPEGVIIEEVPNDSLELWIRVADAGWMGSEQLADEPSPLGKMLATSPSRRYLAWVCGKPAATAAMSCVSDVFSFNGACTRPQFRNRGLQNALTQRRLADAGPGALIQVTALPGTPSHRNLQRVGFLPLYSKLALQRGSRG